MTGFYLFQVSDIIQERSVTHAHIIGAPPTYLFTEVGTFEGDHAHVHRVGDKRLVVHQLVWSEGGDRVQEQLGSLFEVPDGHAVQALVHLQAVPPVPVAPLLNEAAGMDWRVYLHSGTFSDRGSAYLFAFSVLRVMRSLSM